MLGGIMKIQKNKKQNDKKLDKPLKGKKMLLLNIGTLGKGTGGQQ